MQSDTFMETNGIISLEMVLGFHEEIMANQITRQSPYQFCHKISIKSTTLPTVSILPK